MSDVTLSKAIRSNLLHLQNTANLMDVTQERLATGKKVNSALDNPTNFFTASALNSRASDISTLLDAMSNGIQTIEAADNGLSSITKTIESMQSTLRQARQDKSHKSDSYTMPTGEPAGSEQLVLSGGSIAAEPGIPINLTKSGPDFEWKSVDELVREINGDADLKNRVRAYNDNGKLRIENQSTSAMSINGIDASGMITGTDIADDDDRASIGGNDVRRNYATQFAELRTQLDRYAEDASYNGVNLLRGDELKILFDELGKSSLEVQTKDAAGNAISINSLSLGIEDVSPPDLDLDSSIDERLVAIQGALNAVRSQASNLGSTLSIVKNRENFTKQMINTLQTGAANLTLADSNEEAANMLALQTRQQLSQTALSLANQADQAVLRLFG